MKRKIFLLFFVLLASAGYSMAQSTGLFTYNGGYFIKDGNTWYEYRPGDKAGVWATYTQYGEEKNFYNLENNDNVVSVPKDPANSFYVAEKGGEWRPIYTSRNFYNYFADSGRDLYCYNGGYFVRDGNSWKEYRPADKQTVWASFTQYSSDDQYFYIESSADKVAIPRSKSVSGSIFIYRNNDWESIYTVSDIYESKSNGYYAASNSSSIGNSHNSSNSSNGRVYDFTLTFQNYEVWDEKEECYGETIYAPCSISINRKGYGLVTYGSKNVEFRFVAVKPYENTVGSGDGILYGLLFGVSLDAGEGFYIYKDFDGKEELVSYVDSNINDMSDSKNDECTCYISGIPGLPDMRFNNCTSRKVGKAIYDIIKDQKFFNN